MPGTPGAIPSTPALPGTPGTKSAGAPAIPGNPQVKPASTPETPGTPLTPGTPAIPGAPATPGAKPPGLPAPSGTPGSKPSQGTPSSSGNNNFQQDCVDTHNKLRARHGSPPLIWNKQLEVHAQGWANHLANRNIFKHDIAGLTKYGEGENIAWFSTTGAGSFACSQAVQSWYNEVKDYDYQKGDAKTPGKQVLHFTQVSKLYILNTDVSFVYT